MSFGAKKNELTGDSHTIFCNKKKEFANLGRNVKGDMANKAIVTDIASVTKDNSKYSDGVKVYSSKSTKYPTLEECEGNLNTYGATGGKKSRRKSKSSKKSHRKSSKKQRKSRRGGKSRRGRR